MLGAFNAAGFIDQDSQGFASAVQAVGKQAEASCSGLLASSSWVRWAMMNTFFLCRVSLANQRQGGASGGLAGA